jgi:hypothetical protein
MDAPMPFAVSPQQIRKLNNRGKEVEAPSAGVFRKGSISAAPHEKYD